jgi:ABC-type enterochelin transport system substrate-binding protein
MSSPASHRRFEMTDSQLARLFQQQERAERELAMIRARIAAARPEYAARHGLLAYPSVETMRKAVGA